MSIEANSPTVEAEDNKNIPDVKIGLDEVSLMGEGSAASHRLSSLTSDLLLHDLKEIAAIGNEPSLFWDPLTRYIIQKTGADVVIIFGYKPSDEEWFLYSSHGISPSLLGGGSRLPRGWQSLTTIISHEASRSLFSRDITCDRRFVGQMIRGTSVRTFVGATLDVDVKSLGALVMGFNEPDAMTDEDHQSFLSFSNQISSFLLTQPSLADASPQSLKLETAPPETPIPYENDGQEVQISTSRSQSVSLSPPVEADSLSKTEGGPLPIFEPSSPLVVEGSPPLSSPPSKRGQRPPTSRVQGKGLPSTKISSDAQSTRSQQQATSRTTDDLQVKLLEAILGSFSSIFHGEDFYEEVLRKIVAALKVDIGYLFRWDHDSQRLFPVASDGVSLEVVRRISRSGIRPDPIWGKVIDKGQPLLLPSESWKSPLKKKLCGEEVHKSQVTVPLYCKDDIWVLSLFHADPFSQKDLKLVEWVGEKIGLASEAITQWKDLSKKVERADVIQNFLDALIYGDIVTLLDKIKEAIRASNVYLLLVDEQRNSLFGHTASTHAPEGISHIEVPMSGNLISLAIRQQHPITVEHLPSDPRMDRGWVERFRSRSICAVPLVVAKRSLGILLIDETAYFRRFTPDEIETAQALARPAAKIISTALLYQESLRHRERLETLTLAVLRTHEGERRAIARCLDIEIAKKIEAAHKGVCEVIEQISAVSEGAPVLTRLEENKNLLKEAACHLKAALADTRLATLEKQGLIPAVREQAQNFSEDTGVPVTLNLPSSLKRFFPGSELVIYRIIQEALSNVKKHAGAKTVVLTMEFREPFLHFSISDDGRGFDAKRYFVMAPVKRRGLGIVGMKARVDLLGGVFFIESAEQQGTRLSVKIPITKRDGL